MHLDPMILLLNYIRSLTDFGDKSWKMLQPALEKVSFRKDAYLLKEGEVCNSLFYVGKGYCRSYYLVDGDERNSAFYFENEIATNVHSFGSGEKSLFAIKACEPMEVITFDKQKLIEVSAKCVEIEQLGRNCIRRFTTRQQEFDNLLRLYSPKERLLFMERNYPSILQRVSLTQLASFLGIARETLSRLRKKAVSLIL
jgi:CRP-like cAMP-binding protein